MFDVVVVGSLNLDLVVRAPRLPGPGETVAGHGYVEHAGGKGLNQAVAAARSGARTALVGSIGDDDAGDRLRRVARDAGVDTTYLTVHDGTPTGRALITVDDSAENTIVVVPGANARTVVTELPPARSVVAQLEVPVSTVEAAFRIARQHGARTVLNPAPATALPDELLAVTDVVVPNEHELALLGGRSHLLGRGPRTVVVTQGVAGVSVGERTPDGVRQWHQSSFVVVALDSTGAGDAFCGVLAGALATAPPDPIPDLAAAVRRAAAAGALAVTTAGAVPSLPTRAAIEELLTTQPGAGGPTPPSPPPR